MVDPRKFKSVMVTNEDHERLKKFGTIGMHYGDVVRRLLDMAEERREEEKLTKQQNQKTGLGFHTPAQSSADATTYTATVEGTTNKGGITQVEQQ